MKYFKFVLFALFFIILVACAGIKPKNFTYHFKDEYTGIDTLIDIQGYYFTQRACDTAYHSMFMFYDNGLFTIATGSDLTALEKCFREGGNTPLCRYPQWGTYRIEKNKIRTQVVLEEGIGVCVIFRDYLILPEKKLINLSDFVQPEYTNLGNLKNYPSFMDNPCPDEIDFYPLTEKRDSLECPLLKRAYFLEK